MQYYSYLHLFYFFLDWIYFFSSNVYWLNYHGRAGPKIKKAETRLFWNLDDSEYTGVAIVGLGKKDAGYNEQEEVHEGKENVREAAAGSYLYYT